MAHHKTIKQMANEFRVWQYYTAHNWDVRQKDVAEALGLHQGTVSAMVARKGWSERIEAASRRNIGETARRRFHRNGWKVDVNALDLTDLIRD
jgi:hypothetical protein